MEVIEIIEIIIKLGVGLSIGSKSNLGRYCYMGCSGGVTIGNNVMIGPRVGFYSENHNFKQTSIPMINQGVSRKSIKIEDDCWIGSNSVILAGITIGRGSIIASGAVVNSNIPEYSIVGGVPARILSNRKK